MGRLGQQSESQVLQTYARRAQATRKGSARMGADYRHPRAIPVVEGTAVMNWMRSFLLRLGNLLRKERLERDLENELASHLELHIADNLRAGMTPEEARRTALLKLGGVEQTKESVRDVRLIPWLDSLRRDAFY